MENPLRLLDLPVPQSVDELPKRIERLDVAAFDVTVEIQSLADVCAVVEEEATAEAASESNADKRKVRRSEILRDDADYNRQRAEIKTLERTRYLLQSRSHRIAREFRLCVSRNYAQVI